jgi:hypothetical protein
LAAVEQRRLLATRVTQRIQVLLHDRVIRPSLAARTWKKPPFLARWFRRWPILRRIPARLVGLGIRPEQVRAEILAGSPPLPDSS